MDQYTLFVEASIQQFEKELRDAVDTTPTGDDNTLFLLEGATPEAPDHGDIVMIVYHPEELGQEPPEGWHLGSSDWDMERAPEGRPRQVKMADWGPQPRQEEVRPAIRCRYFLQAPPVMRVSVVCVDERARDYCSRLVPELGRRFPGALQRAPEAEQVARKPRQRLGPRSLAEREDWPEKLALLARWEKAIQKPGADKEAQAHLIGQVSARTMQRWRKLRDDSN